MKSRYAINSLTFSFYTPEELKKISVVEIKSPISFDTFGHPLPSGLYDPRLGPLNERFGLCQTCNLNFHDCPGHFGHISFDTPVLNPLCFEVVYQLANSVCHHCYKFRVSSREKLTFYAGMIITIKGHSPKILDLHKDLNEIDYCSKVRETINSLDELPFNNNDHYDECQSFLRKASSLTRCAECRYKSTVYKKDGNCALVRDGHVILPEDLIILFEKLSFEEKEILELCFRNSSQIINSKNNKMGEHCLNINSDKQYVKSSYYSRIFGEYEDDFLDRICLNRKENTQFDTSMFFLHHIPVTPNKFRPMAYLGNRTYESPVNNILSIIIKNSKGEIDLADDNAVSRTSNFTVPSKGTISRFANTNNSKKKLNTEENEMQEADYEGSNSSSDEKSDEDVDKLEIEDDKENNSDSKDENENNSGNKNNIKINSNQIYKPSYSIENYMVLQNNIYLFFDSSDSGKAERIIGIKQILEKKEGLFRKHMMGKRVNHAARSVISPDPHLHTREIGIPMVFAETLTFPEYVNLYNYDRLKKAVISGIQYPGARILETIDNSGFKIKYDLSILTEPKRVELANKMLSHTTIVHRQLKNDDVVLVNRQPTLHKPSIMAHRAKVLPGEKTIRMHYANCNSYNADFDGDEMNIHFLQDQISRAEGYLLMSNDHNYLVSKNNSPVRGLVQDHIVVCSRLCLKGEFISKEEYLYYIASCSTHKVNITENNGYLLHEVGDVELYHLQQELKKGQLNNKLGSSYKKNYKDMTDESNLCSTRNINNTNESLYNSNKKNYKDMTDESNLCSTINKNNINESMYNTSKDQEMQNNIKDEIRDDDFFIDKPSILRPVVLFTGKQIITSILKSMNIDMNFRGKSKLNDIEDGEVIIRNGYLLKGIIDKNQIGPTNNGLVHMCGKRYGYSICNELLTSFGRVINRVMSRQGFTVRIDDLLLEETGDISREVFCKDGESKGTEVGITELYSSKEVVDIRVNDNELNNRTIIKHKSQVDKDDTGKDFKNTPFDSTNLKQRAIKSTINNKEQNEHDYKHQIKDDYNHQNEYDNKHQNDHNYKHQNEYDNKHQIEHDYKDQNEYDIVQSSKKPINIIRHSQIKNIVKMLYLNDPYFHLNKTTIEVLDSLVKSEMNKTTSKILDVSITQNPYKPFPYNNMSLMILSGAKGSTVNLGQISGLLGQQELEGKRVPYMISGSTLPCYKSGNATPQSGGYIFGRFLDGINPSEYFFHCMAGREGLIDTAVKTARSGYLQRCLIKGLEGLVIEYDLSVRNDDDLIQYMYGELNVQFTEDNNNNISGNKTINAAAVLNINNYKCSTEESDNVKCTICEFNECKISNDYIEKPYTSSKYKVILPDFKDMTPGEGVGILAAQSVGEPSTQMTLNTFHLAGVGSKNVTLGIPRLVEILMIGSKAIKTPIIKLDLITSKAEDIIEKVKKVTLKDVLKRIKIEESIGKQKVEIELYQQISEHARRDILSAINSIMKKKHKTYIYACYSEIDLINRDSSRSKSRKKDYKDENYGGNDEIDLINRDSSRSKNRKKNYKDENYGGNDEIDLINRDSSRSKNRKKNYKDENYEDNNEIISENCDNMIVFYLALDYSRDNLLLMPILEEILPNIVLNEWQGFDSASVSNNTVFLDGSDFYSLCNLVDEEEIYRSYSNDIFSVVSLLGIEAGRSVIVNEIMSVFEVYGIQVDSRHLCLIADFMTREGEYKAFNRRTMGSSKSVLQKMCFESCFKYLKEGSVFGQEDKIENPSSRLCVGHNICVGTGYKFDLIYKQKIEQEDISDL